MQEEIKLLSPHQALRKFASELTTKTRELEKMESEYLIVPGQSTEILTGMIESHIYAVFQTMLANERTRPEDKDAAARAMLLLSKADTNVITAAYERPKADDAAGENAPVEAKKGDAA